jgi:hypothetical protein
MCDICGSGRRDMRARVRGILCSCLCIGELANDGYEESGDLNLF